MPYLLTSLLVVLFFIIIPGLGAFYSRSQWRRFRSNVTDASLMPTVTFENLFSVSDGLVGTFRFIGNLEAIQGDYIWLRNKDLSLSADLKKSLMYVLPSYSYPEHDGFVEKNRETLPDEMPRKIAWNRIFSLPEGTRIFISGSLYTERGKGLFRGSKGQPLTVVIYDGAEQTIIRRSIWGGRQRNEYWNFLTPSSLAAGSFSLFINGYILLRSPYMLLPAITAFTASLIPVLIFAPPGILLFMLYRNLWRRSRFLRAERDLLQLPLRFFRRPVEDSGNASTRLPDNSVYCMTRVNNLDKLPKEAAGEQLKLRTSTLMEEYENTSDDYYVFGVQPDDGSGCPVMPEDPMAEFLVIPGNPEELSHQCARKARRFEIRALLAFAVGLGTNFVITFVLFRLFLT